MAKDKTTYEKLKAIERTLRDYCKIRHHFKDDDGEFEGSFITIDKVINFEDQEDRVFEKLSAEILHQLEK